MEGLRLIAIELVHSVGFVGWITNTSGQITSDIMREFEAAPEWDQFEDEFLALAESKAGGARTANKPESALAAGPGGDLTKKSPGTKAASAGQDLKGNAVCTMRSSLKAF